MTNLKKGDQVVPKGNYKDEQLGESVSKSIQTVTATKPYRDESGTFYWVKTNSEKDWADQSWFKKVK